MLSWWNLPKSSHIIETFITAVNNDIHDASEKSIQKVVLTKEERKSLKHLSDREGIIINKADKGSTVVIWDTKDYIFEANRQLNDTSSYRQLTEDRTEKSKHLLTN